MFLFLKKHTVPTPEPTPWAPTSDCYPPPQPHLHHPLRPPTPEPEPERKPLPPPEKDADFLAEMERERLADLRRQRALEAFESLKQKKFVVKERPIPEELIIKECELLLIIFVWYMHSFLFKDLCVYKKKNQLKWHCSMYKNYKRSSLTLCPTMPAISGAAWVYGGCLLYQIKTHF